MVDPATPLPSARTDEPPGISQALAQAFELYRQGRIAEAERAYAAILFVRPDNADALHFMGLAKLARGQPAEALRSMAAAMDASQPTPRMFFDQGIVLNALGRQQEAIERFDRAIELQPHFFQAHSNRGAMLAALGRHAEAADAYRAALVINPNFVDAHSNLGSALTQLERYDEALASLDRALALRPDFADALYNRGNVLKALKRYDEALADYDRALALRPDHADAHNNRGQVLNALERYDEALVSYDRALALRPQHAMAHCNAAALRLLTGDFARGWAHYEWRWMKDQVVLANRMFAQPRWNGEEEIAGKTILLHSEQGLGDTIQFCRYAPLVAARGARVIFEVQPPLVKLLATLVGGAQIVAKGTSLRRFDLHCPLLSLPLAFGTRLETVPADIGYLRASAPQAERWQTRLAAIKRPRIGLVWSGNARHERDRERSIHLRALLPLLDCAASFVSLQRDLRAEDAPVLKEWGDILDFSSEIEDFSDTAALISQLDLVISVDTSVAHLAGALGKPVWILLTYVPDWRWLLGRDDSPWYPTMRLFRQDASQRWDGVLARVRQSLLDWAKAAPSRV